MEAKAEATPKLSFVEFEPFCDWQREESRDVLVIHLPEFKKDELRVQINNYGILKISGERKVNVTRRSKFYKEVTVAKTCITSNIHAKFINGCLYITMPKKATPTTLTPPQKTKDSSTDQQKSRDQESSKDQVKKSSSNDHSESSEDSDTDSSSDGKDVESDHVIMKKKSISKLAVNLAAVFTVLAALSAYCVYMYRSVVIQD